jgi:cell cycle sensor histidine kinase DivJ
MTRLKAALTALLGHAPPPATAASPMLAEHAADLITRHAPDGRVVCASAASLKLLGRIPAELEGLTPPDLVHAEDVAAVQALFRDASYHGRPGAVAARLRHAAGHHVWTELRCVRTPLTADGGGDIVTVIRDISAWKEEQSALRAARDAALAATTAKSRFIADMSHELRTPLNAIIGFSEVMDREMFGAHAVPRYREYAGLIHDSGSHLLELINGLLDMSKIEAGKFTLHQELFALGEVAEGAAHFVQLAAERAGVALAVEVRQVPQLAFADKRAVKQILVNLLANAIKFTPAGGRVTLTAEKDGAALTLCVADTGAGIAPEDLERLGRPYEQGAQDKDGTGLGLALVKALAGLHGGEAVIESVLGTGTRVTVRLPQAAVDADRPEEMVARFAGAA